MKKMLFGISHILLGAITIAVLHVMFCTNTEIKYEPARSTISKIPDAILEINFVAGDAIPCIEKFELLTSECSVTRSPDLTISLNFKVAKKNTLITDYNGAHNVSSIELPGSISAFRRFE